jgi:hypothetical protein
MQDQEANDDCGRLPGLQGRKKPQKKVPESG